MVWCRHFFLFSLNWPQRDSINGKFLPHHTKKWGWRVCVCEKRSRTMFCFQLSIFKRLVQIQSTKIIQHFIVTDQTVIVNCAIQATIMSENYQVSIKWAQATFYCRKVFQLLLKASAEFSESSRRWLHPQSQPGSWADPTSPRALLQQPSQPTLTWNLRLSKAPHIGEMLPGRALLTMLSTEFRGKVKKLKWMPIP